MVGLVFEPTWLWLVFMSRTHQNQQLEHNETAFRKPRLRREVRPGRGQLNVVIPAHTGRVTALMQIGGKNCQKLSGHQLREKLFPSTGSGACPGVFGDFPRGKLPRPEDKSKIGDWGQGWNHPSENYK